MAFRRSIQRAVCLAASCAGACLLALPARGDEVRSYTDSQGIVHLYNGAAHRRAVVPRWTDSEIPMMLIDAQIARSADFYKLPAALVKAVIATESNFRTGAVSAKGAIGLMQLMPETARAMFVDDPYDWIQNIEGGTRYLRVLVNRFDGDLFKVLAAYNAGPEQVLRCAANGGLGIPPFEETVNYVKKVLRNYQAFKAQPPSS